MKKTLLVLLLSVAMLMGMGWLQTQIPWVAAHTRPFNLLAWMQEAPRDTVITLADQMRQQGISEDSILAIQKYTGREFILPFHASLRKLKQNAWRKNTQVRVFYFSDSMNEGDLITQYLRDSLQRMFGGTGVGFVPMTSITNEFRGTVKHKFSDDWNYYQAGKAPRSVLLGISGESFYPAPSGSWAEYRPSGAFPGVSSFPSVRVFYGGYRPDSTDPDQEFPPVFAAVVCGDGEPDTVMLETMGECHEMRLCAQTVNAVRVSFESNGDVPIFGMSFESPYGVIIDNFSLRGSSGMHLYSIRSSVLSAFNTYMQPDLIILHFGLNMVSPEQKEMSWYDKGMGNTVKHLQEAFPGVPILMVSLSDKATKIDGKLQTDPSVPLILEAQQKIASDYRLGFFNLFDAMGGEGSIQKWADAKPALANKDYTHPNARGARVVADLLIKYLMEGYYPNEDSMIKKAGKGTTPIPVMKGSEK